MPYLFISPTPELKKVSQERGSLFYNLEILESITNTDQQDTTTPIKPALLT